MLPLNGGKTSFDLNLKQNKKKAIEKSLSNTCQLYYIYDLLHVLIIITEP